MKIINLKRKLIKNKLLNYGFIYKDDIYFYEKDILNNKFKIVINISDNKLSSKVIDNNTLDEYILVDIDDAVGSYVGKVKEEYANIINDIINTCTSNDIYFTKQAKDVLKYIKKTYSDVPEYLWKKEPKSAAIRNKYNNKWYLLIMPLNVSKLGLNSDEEIEIINLKYRKGKTKDIIDNINIFPAYHMNKESWITIKLDGTLDIYIIYSLIDNSYDLSLK